MSDDVLIRLGLRGQAEVSRGLRKTAGETRDVGDAAETAGAKAREMGAQFSRGTDRATHGVRNLVGAFALFQGAQGLGRLTVAGVKWGLSFNAQVESARLRFGLFTNDVEGLTKSVQKIDLTSQFNFGDLADAAALFGNNGVKNIPAVLQATANAAAASGKGTQGFQSIAIALSQIAAKGKLSQEEINQLNEAGAPGAQRIIAKHFNLTAKELGNLGGQGLDAQEAIKALTAEWTSGRMAKAAEAQTKTLGGQWQLLTGNMQKAAGAATFGLAQSLEKKVLPAANKAAGEITEIFGQNGLSNEEKIKRARAVIVKDLGPVADDLKDKIDEADIPGKLGDLVKLAAPKMAAAAGEVAPDVAKAFVEAWLHSGPWIQLASLLVLAGKIGGAKGGGGGLAGGLGNLLTKSKPIPVWVVNEGAMPGGVPGSTSASKIKTAGRIGLETAGKTAGVGGLLYGAYLGYKSLYDLVTPPHHTGPPQLKSPADRAVDQQVLASRAAATSLGTPGPWASGYKLPPIQVSVVVNDREVATANAKGNAKQRARN